MIDLTIISQSLGAYIAPFLPILLKYGSKLTDDALKKLGEGIGTETWGKVKSIWQGLFPKIETDDKAKEALDQIATEIEKEGTNAQVGPWLRNVLSQLLSTDQALTEQLKGIIENAQKEENNGNVFQIQKQIAKYITNINHAENIKIGDQNNYSASSSHP